MSFCDVRHDFRIKNIFDLSLPPVVCRMVHVLFIFASVLWCSTFLDNASNMVGVLLETGTAYPS